VPWGVTRDPTACVTIATIVKGTHACCSLTDVAAEWVKSGVDICGEGHRFIRIQLGSHQRKFLSYRFNSVLA